MRKIILLGALSLCLLLTACTNTNVQPEDRDYSSQSQEDSKETSSQEEPQIDSEESGMGERDYFDTLCDTLLTNYNEEYLKTKAFMPVEDEVINGENCYVYKMGTDTPDHFATEDWFAISKTGDVYWLDIVLNEWVSFDEAFNVNSLPFSQEDVDVCLYMLNEYLRDEFAVEYRDMPEEIKQAVFSEETCTDAHTPDKLIGILEEIPTGYYADPLVRSYYPVYSFDSFDSLVQYFSNYFTEGAMRKVEQKLSENFLDFEGTLYLVRGGRGYGTVTLDFDCVDYSRLSDEGIVVVDSLLFGEKYGKYKLGLSYENGQLKIDFFEEIVMYNFESEEFSYKNAQVPDLMAFISNNEEFTYYDSITYIDGKMIINYFGDYYESLPEYIELLKTLGFETTVDGWEGYYQLEKDTSYGTLCVNAYFMNEEDGVVIEIT